MFPRFFYSEAMTSEQVIELPVNTRHHAIRVLRLRKDDTVTLFNGQGGEYLAQIEHNSKTRTTIKIIKYCEIERESSLNIELVQAICPNEKMDWIIQKSVELGINYIQPVTTKRSVVKLSSERASKRLHHWQQIVVAACEQCGRNHVPEVRPLMGLSDWFSNNRSEQSGQQHDFILSMSAALGLKHFPYPSGPQKITILVGPEGGLMPEEESIASLSGFKPLRMGKRILRTETAALATVAAMQVLWGDY